VDRHAGTATIRFSMPDPPALLLDQVHRHTDAEGTGGRTAMNTAMGRLVKAELKLMTRDPLVLTFVFAFPVVTMLIIGGAFGTRPNPGFEGANPAHWYVASYLTVVIAATGLVMLPVHLASYRERGVLRRFAAAGFPRWSFAIAQLAVGLATTAMACALLCVSASAAAGTDQLTVRIDLDR
jgi:ABC-2 type transport system permease protein